MNRAKAMFITKRAVYMSPEFDGDMYPSAHGGYGFGELFIAMLREARTAGEFESLLKKFNRISKHFDKSTKVTATQRMDIQRTIRKQGRLDISKWDYKAEILSDWLVVVVAKKRLTFKAADGYIYKFERGDVRAFPYGKGKNSYILSIMIDR